MTAPTEESNIWAGAPKLLTLSDEEIEDLFGNANFGISGETPEGRRGLMVESVLKHAAGYSAGSTLCRICQKVGLVDAQYKATPLGSRWAFNQIYQSDTTIVERLTGVGITRRIRARMKPLHSYLNSKELNALQFVLGRIEDGHVATQDAEVFLDVVPPGDYDHDRRGHNERVHEEYNKRFPEKTEGAAGQSHGYEFACGCVVTDGARSHCDKHGTALMHNEPDYPEGEDSDVVRRF